MSVILHETGAVNMGVPKCAKRNSAQPRAQTGAARNQRGHACEMWRRAFLGTCTTDKSQTRAQQPHEFDTNGRHAQAHPTLRVAVRLCIRGERMHLSEIRHNHSRGGQARDEGSWTRVGAGRASVRSPQPFKRLEHCQILDTGLASFSFGGDDCRDLWVLNALLAWQLLLHDSLYLSSQCALLLCRQHSNVRFAHDAVPSRAKTRRVSATMQRQHAQ